MSPFVSIRAVMATHRYVAILHIRYRAGASIVQATTSDDRSILVAKGDHGKQKLTQSLKRYFVIDVSLPWRRGRLTHSAF